MKLFNRFFYRGVKGAEDTEDFKVFRKLGKNGNSYTISIPPTVVEDLNLYEGVIIEKKKDCKYLTIKNRKGA